MQQQRTKNRQSMNGNEETETRAAKDIGSPTSPTASPPTSRDHHLGAVAAAHDRLPASAALSKCRRLCAWGATASPSTCDVLIEPINCDLACGIGKAFRCCFCPPFPAEWVPSSLGDKMREHSPKLNVTVVVWSRWIIVAQL
jgi:hypothetical protein